jgi:hypothetical protein
MEAGLTECPLLLTHAFVEALNATVQPFHPEAAKAGSAVKIANGLLSEWELDSSRASTISKLVHLQTQLLLAMAADGYGPALSGPSKTSFLARAMAIAYSMGLPSMQVRDSVEVSEDPDTLDRQMRRAWWILVALDRWNCTARGQPPLIAQEAVALSPDLKTLFGDSGRLFLSECSTTNSLRGISFLTWTALTHILGSWSGSLYPRPSPESSAYAIDGAMSEHLHAGLDVWRMSVPESATSTSHTVQFLAYWYCRLMGYLLLPPDFPSRPAQVLWALRELVQLLASDPRAAPPLAQYLVALAALCAAALTRVEVTRAQATEALSELMDLAAAVPAWEEPVAAAVKQKMSVSAAAGVAAATASQGLQRLAELATSEKAEAEDTGSDSFEDAVLGLRRMLRDGYLNFIGGSHGAMK